MPSSPKPSNPLHERLAHAESELSRRLQEACETEAQGLSNPSADEIRDLEDALLSAASAAQQVITARRRLEEAPRTDSSSAGPPEDPAVSTAVREFNDETGRSWRAWPVVPGVTSARDASRRSLGDFQEGWICFEALDNSGRRRLPRREPRWTELPSEELQRLLAEAIDARERKPRRS